MIHPAQICRLPGIKRRNRPVLQDLIETEPAVIVGGSDPARPSQEAAWHFGRKGRVCPSCDRSEFSVADAIATAGQVKDVPAECRLNLEQYLAAVSCCRKQRRDLGEHGPTSTPGQIDIVGTRSK